ncbi:MAG: 16S rRNA (guanine(966)-N(2))-methyltransferase RsmD [Firmicutes bacterium]|nr:16S rRNA (guanine(966)-N(2))-methyltransferase RsmD [Bacillota bacterium]
MRIISGKYKGRNIEGYNIIGTRPTMDRVKESLIGIIQNKLKNSVCLDLFAGSGSIGIEFLSNGASSCYFVDNNKKVIDTIKMNINKIKIEEESHLVLNDFHKALKLFKERNIKFDIIFLDPPYQNNYIQESLKIILEYNLLNKNGIIICEYEVEDFSCSLEIIKEKKYGSKKIRIYKNFN